ncbi:MAG: response regulator transcription factor [Deltaproteobacteria bacterium]|nr:response regulator transcription factor [Deltaproteobacteria bacterium]
MIHVLVVDDHAIFREGVKKIIGGALDMEVTAEARDGAEAVAKILEGSCDVVVLDLGLPKMAGMDVLRTMKARRPTLPFVVLSIHTEEEYAVTVLKEGASGYLNKECVPDDLLKAIRKAVRGGIYVSDSLSEGAVLAMLGRAKEKPHHSLSETEYRVFRLIVKGASVKEIAHSLSIARSTASTYRARIMRKMGMTTNVELARYAARNNLED